MQTILVLALLLAIQEIESVSVQHLLALLVGALTAGFETVVAIRARHETVIDTSGRPPSLTNIPLVHAVVLGVPLLLLALSAPTPTSLISAVLLGLVLVRLVAAVRSLFLSRRLRLPLVPSFSTTVRPMDGLRF